MGTAETKQPSTSGATKVASRQTRARKTTEAAASGSATAVAAASPRPVTVRRLSQAHKEAIATGRGEALVVRRYLEALVSNRPRPGRKRGGPAIEARLATIESELAKATGVERLKLVQERIDLQTELSAADPEGQAALEDGFVAVAASYSSRRGISRAAWRELGVPPAVLRRAGLAR